MNFEAAYCSSHKLPKAKCKQTYWMRLVCCVCLMCAWYAEAPVFPAAEKKPVLRFKTQLMGMFGCMPGGQQVSEHCVCSRPLEHRPSTSAGSDVSVPSRGTACGHVLVLRCSGARSFCQPFYSAHELPILLMRGMNAAMPRLCSCCCVRHTRCCGSRATLTQVAS